jgi:multiple sugar transport system substrate-binding protein
VKATKAAAYCFAPSAKYAGEFYFLWGSIDASAGGKLFDADGKPIFQNDGRALAASELIKQGIDKGYFDPAGVAMDDYETLVEYGNGKEAFLLNSTWSVTQANTNKDLSKIRGESGLILIPGAAGTRTGGFLYAGGLGLLKTSTHKDEAKKFLTFLTSEPAQKQHAIDGANMPTRIALYQDKDIAAAWAGFPVLAEQLPYGQFAPPFPWFDEWRHSLAASLQDLIRGAKTPKEQIQFLVEEADRIAAK